MSIVKISEVALKEFKELLKDNKIETNTVRIVISGIG
ncbi:HesB-like selenoprotein [Hathewaya histolytica]|uniref:HesB-like selenoprotein n=1 Tax=Hathewaya histolytica TaxID=1498 RepID=A0A4U9RQ01_HATHI|nr:HesB-like selenoprotein [Hathewaya histolytica]